MKFRIAHDPFRRACGALLALPLALTASQALAQGVTDDMLLNAHKESDNWRMVGRDYMSTRFSPLTQVNTKNVKRLVPKWSFSFGVLDAQNTTPLIHDGVMYVTSSHGRTFAVDAKTGSMIWQYHHQLPEDVGKTMCCDIGNRGAALYGDKVFVATPDAHVVALDMKTGKPVWDVTLGDYKNSYTMTVAPLVVKGKVIVGLSGAEYPTRLFIEALDASTGKQVWRRYTIPAPGEPGSETWGSDPDNLKYAGCVGLDHGFIRSGAQHDLLGYRQPEPRLGRRRSPGRQPLLQFHPRIGPGQRCDQVPLPVHALRCVGFRRCERAHPRRSRRAQGLAAW